MSKTRVRRGLVDGTARLEELMKRPGLADAVAEIRREMREADAAHAMSLAMIRKAAELTQADLAERMRVTQGAVARTEQREDVLLSTLHSYAAAAGARITVVVELKDGRIARVELDEAGLAPASTVRVLPDRQQRSQQPRDTKGTVEVSSIEASAPSTERVKGGRRTRRAKKNAMARKERHVVPNEDGGWDVIAPGGKRASAHAATQADAIDRAREIVRNDGGGEVVIHGRDGRIRDSDTIAPGHDPNPPRHRK